MLLAIGCSDPTTTTASSATPSSPKVIASAAASTAPVKKEPDGFAQSLQTFCKIARDSKNDPLVKKEKDKSAQASMRAQLIAKQFQESHPDPELLRMFQRMSNDAPEGKYPALVAAAREHGLEGWTCPELAE
jgi:hypothetical protein